MAHSYFFQDALRGSISRKVGCEDPMQPKGLESKRYHGTCRFRREPLSPVGDADPIAEFSPLLRGCDGEPDGAAKFSAPRNRDGKGDRTPRAEVVIRMCKEIPRVALRVRMRNADCRGSDFARSGETHDRGDIAAFDGTQQQMGSAQFLRSGHISEYGNRARERRGDW